nr:PREDICTED: uncharacterized protein LOC108951422 isoform X3 [Musa acuminata subsp. malaccensis]
MSNVVDLKCSGNAVYFFLHHALSVGSRYGMLDSLERYEIMSSGALVPSLFKRCSILSTLRALIMSIEVGYNFHRAAHFLMSYTPQK